MPPLAIPSLFSVGPASPYQSLSLLLSFYPLYTSKLCQTFSLSQEDVTPPTPTPMRGLWDELQEEREPVCLVPTLSARPEEGVPWTHMAKPACSPHP